MHTLKALHADPHPGNFIITNDHNLGIIDFGCVKVIPASFHKTYFQLQDDDVLTNVKKRDKVFKELRFVYDDDQPKDKAFFTDVFSHLVELLTRPFRHDIFDFSDEQYFREMYYFGEELSNMKELRESKKARGVRDSLYINRTYFGLYNILHDLKAEIKVRD
jgi:predicted unusual protein kinase regulating ubiquinone biosynthesis (AarF/ABC1/UbiB family)